MSTPSSNEIPEVLPVLPLKETVVFPYVIVPLSIEPDRGVQAVERAMADRRLIMLVARRDADAPGVSLEHLYTQGTVGLIMRMLKLPDGRMRVLVQGLERAELLSLVQEAPYLKGRIRRVDSEDEAVDETGAPEGPESVEPGDGEPTEAPAEAPAEGHSEARNEALVRNARELLEKAIHLGKSLSPEIMVLAANIDDPGRFADLVASNLELHLSDAQLVLETAEPAERLSRVTELLIREIELLEMQHALSVQAHEEIDRSHREFFLRQQLKAIREELGELEDLSEDIAQYRQAADEKGMSDEGRQEMEKQIRRLERSHPESGDSPILRTYLDWLTGLPWQQTAEEDLELDRARRVLNADHHGLEKVKERILEYLAVRRLRPDAKGPILCFVGPPGVGKTSLGRSIARALGRRFLRLSLGGVRDEAEIRGHRRTYVGAMPGRIVQGLHQCGSANPLFMLDEIDKIGSDYRGDPSAALLEVLDPEQNQTFRDHYLGVSYDLSKVLFITTANLLDPIQPAFLDRMEVIRIPGYTEEEKATIARRHLLPKQIHENGLDGVGLHVTERGLRRLIRGYTREAGLRNLEREIGSLCRKIAVRVASGQRYPSRLDEGHVERFLGPERHFEETLLDRHRVGVATGLAWTAVGGDVMIIEVTAVPGKGKLHLTGRLGEVMRESAQTAWTYVRAYAARHPETLHLDRLAVDLGESKDGPRRPLARLDFHIHAPAGSIPKDGPSAGITIATALISLLTARAVDRTVAMTGEITLRGEILPIGGLREKALAARAVGIAKVLIPEPNRRDLKELPDGLTDKVDLLPVGHMDEVLAVALRPAEAEDGPADGD